MTHTFCGIFLTLAALVPAAPAATAVAVFNFQMKSDTPDWLWLEKGLADRLIGDIYAQRELVVLDRDRMQEVAEKTHWAPEMQGDLRRTPKMGFQAKYLISGVYEVAGEKLTITAIVIDFISEKEVARRTASGAAKDALDLQRRLSSELLAWLTKRQPEAVLAELPAWTRSLAASKVLYEGVHLYDQGRYAEAWLLFRQAARDDPQYIDALYFTGKMYYFMSRYEHARLAFEEYFYRVSRRHPRVGDAIREYTHTYEAFERPEKLLELYDRLEERFPPDPAADVANREIRIYTNDSNNANAASDWIALRRAMVQTHLGDDLANMRLFRGKSYLTIMGPALQVNIGMLRNNMLTGSTLSEADMRNYLDVGSYDRIIRFKSNDTEAAVNIAPSPYFPQQYVILVAPDKQVFRRLHFVPVADSLPDGATLALALSLTAEGDIGQQTRPMKDATVNGFTFDSLPRTGLLLLSATPSAGTKCRLRILPEFEPVGPHGALDVVCSNATDFRVLVDGRPGRYGPGLVGLLPPGEHKLRFVPARDGTPFEPWETRATVVEGHITLVEGHLAWRSDSAWRRWSLGVHIGDNYPGYILTRAYGGEGHIRTADGTGGRLPRPALQVDEKAIRVVWTYGFDLWLSESRDGESFSPPRKLDLPVSTAWEESNPQLVRDETGRFVLTFLSDRDILHHVCLCSCWSRDLVHWSAPAMILDQDPFYYDFAQGSSGEFLIVTPRNGIWGSMDACHWAKVAEAPALGCCRLVSREDGGCDLLGLVAGKAPAQSRETYRYELLRFRSTDGRQWSAPERIATHETLDLVAARAAGKTYAVAPLVDPSVPGRWLYAAQPFCETPDGRWEQLPRLVSLGDRALALAWHPRWGCLITWFVPPDNRVFCAPLRGPYLIRGPDFDGLRKTLPPAAKGAALEEVATAPKQSAPPAKIHSEPPRDAAEFMAALDRHDLAKVEAGLASHREWATATSADGRPAIHVAAARGFDDLVTMLLRNGADVDVTHHIAGDYISAGETVTPLVVASGRGHTSVVRALLAAGAQVNLPTSLGRTPLHAACQARNLETVKMLVEAGANIEAVSAHKFTPLHSALFGYSPGKTTEVARFLIEKGANVNVKNHQGFTPLHLATEWINDSPLIELLLAKGADIAARDEGGETPLHAAAGYNAADICTLLLRKGADVGARDQNGITPLHIAADRGNEEGAKTVAALLAKGADPMAQNNYGYTPLSFAAEAGVTNTELIANAVLAAHGDLDLPSKDGHTPLHIAASLNKEVVALLIAKGAKVDQRDNEGRTPLMYAVSHETSSGSDGRRVGIATVLIDKGADVNARDNSGKSVLELAIAKGHKPTVTLLRERGAKE